MGFAPMILYAWFMWWIDRYEKEPFWLLVLAFFWGAIPSVILAIIPQILAGFTMGGEGVGNELLMASLVAPATEEVAKGLAIVILFLAFRHEIDSLLDGIVYGSMVGFGFAATENFLYGTGALLEAGILGVVVLGFLRGVIFGLNHAFFTSLTGMGFALARHGRSGGVRFLGPLVGLALGMTAHGLHNFGATLVGESLLWLGFSLAVDWLGIAGVFVVILLTLSKERKWIERELAEEVAWGIVSQDEARVLASSWTRFGNLWGAFFGKGPMPRGRLAKFYQTATELAFAKRHLRELADDPRAAEKIQALRAKVAELRGGPPATSR